MNPLSSRHLMVVIGVVAMAMLSACATVSGPTAKDYTVFRNENPKSILVVPALNNTGNVTAPDFFLSTVSRPFAERGYYVFPAHMVNRVLNDSGLSDAGLVHSTDPRRLEPLFGCDAVLFVNIDQWDSKYAILATVTTVKFEYILKSCKTGELLWGDTQTMAYSPQNNNSSGNLLADLIAQAVIAAMEKGAPNYMPMTIQANAVAAGAPGQGLPAGPYLPSAFQKDLAVFPSH
jgi:hypothetical protein